jgi:hypothetical protein
MGINGRVGRAKFFAKMKKDRQRLAKAAGIDIANRAAFKAWERDQSNEFWNGLRSKIRENKS